MQRGGTQGVCGWRNLSWQWGRNWRGVGNSMEPLRGALFGAPGTGAHRAVKVGCAHAQARSAAQAQRAAPKKAARLAAERIAKAAAAQAARAAKAQAAAAAAEQQRAAAAAAAAAACVERQAAERRAAQERAAQGLVAGLGSRSGALGAPRPSLKLKLGAKVIRSPEAAPAPAAPAAERQERKHRLVRAQIVSFHRPSASCKVPTPVPAQKLLAAHPRDCAQLARQSHALPAACCPAQGPAPLSQASMWPGMQAPDGKKAHKKRRLSDLPSGGGTPAPAPLKLHLHLQGPRPPASSPDPKPARAIPVQLPAYAPPPPPAPPPQQRYAAAPYPSPSAYPAPPCPAVAARAPPKKAAGGARKTLLKGVLSKVLNGAKRRLTAAQLQPFKVRMRAASLRQTCPWKCGGVGELSRQRCLHSRTSAGESHGRCPARMHMKR